MPKVAFITAIIGNYERTCKPFVRQSVETDLLCFTNRTELAGNGWTIDTEPYHRTQPSPRDTGAQWNSLTKNSSDFNVAKYYKQAWPNIRRLQAYDVVLWLDATLEVISPSVSARLLDLCPRYGIVAWIHEWRHGRLSDEVRASRMPRYCDTNYGGQPQPYQDVEAQYRDYLRDGYDEDFWKNCPRREGRGIEEHFGVWITGFLGFDARSPGVRDFLDRWYGHTLRYTTQDQVSFPKVIQETGIVPYTLPDEKFTGNCPLHDNSVFHRHPHGT